MMPTVFRDVYSLYGAADIRGSSDARNVFIEEDLTEHLPLARDVLEAALEARDLPALEELCFRIGEHARALCDGVSTGDEMTVVSFLQAIGVLLDEPKYLDLDDLPGVKGLKALRVGVNLESRVLTERVRRIMAEPRIPGRLAS